MKQEDGDVLKIINTRRNYSITFNIDKTVNNLNKDLGKIEVDEDKGYTLVLKKNKNIFTISFLTKTSQKLYLSIKNNTLIATKLPYSYFLINPYKLNLLNITNETISHYENLVNNFNYNKFNLNFTLNMNNIVLPKELLFEHFSTKGQGRLLTETVDTFSIVPLNWIFSRNPNQDDYRDPERFLDVDLTKEHYLTSVQDSSINIPTDTTTGGATNPNYKLEFREYSLINGASIGGMYLHRYEVITNGHSEGTSDISEYGINVNITKAQIHKFSHRYNKYFNPNTASGEFIKKNFSLTDERFPAFYHTIKSIKYNGPGYSTMEADYCGKLTELTGMSVTMTDRKDTPRAKGYSFCRDAWWGGDEGWGYVCPNKGLTKANHPWTSGGLSGHLHCDLSNVTKNMKTTDRDSIFSNEYHTPFTTITSSAVFNSLYVVITGTVDLKYKEYFYKYEYKN